LSVLKRLDPSRLKMPARKTMRRPISLVMMRLSVMKGIAVPVLEVTLVPPTSYKDRRTYKYATTVLRHRRCPWKPCVTNRVGNQ